MKSYTLRVAEGDKDIFDAIQSGAKSIESRAGTVKYQHIAVGGTLIFSCAEETFSKVVTKRYHWASVEEMFGEVSLHSVMPWVGTIEEAKAVILSFPNYEEKIKEHGLVGFALA